MTSLPLLLAELAGSLTLPFVSWLSPACIAIDTAQRDEGCFTPDVGRMTCTFGFGSLEEPASSVY